MTSVLGGLLRAVAGPELPPARPFTLGRRWLFALLPTVTVLAAVGLVAAATQYLRETRDLGWLWALPLGAASVIPAALAWRWPLWAWRLAYLALFAGVAGRLATEAWPWNPVQILATLIVLFAVALGWSAGRSPGHAC
ncbi:MAG TPA: hypothetical protein VGJ63_19235 [Micromonosporaceae bacterium]